MEIITLGQKMKEINDRFYAWTDKLTSNGLVASCLTLVFFIVICLAVSSFAKK